MASAAREVGRSGLWERQKMQGGGSELERNPVEWTGTRRADRNLHQNTKE